MTDEYPLQNEDKQEAILLKTTAAEVLAQIAEEAAELSQAALKYRRCLIDNNPTPVDVKTALSALIEEKADVEVCWDVLFDYQPTYLRQVYQKKLDRWYERVSRNEM